MYYTALLFSDYQNLPAPHDPTYVDHDNDDSDYVNNEVTSKYVTWESETKCDEKIFLHKQSVIKTQIFLVFRVRHMSSKALD